MTTLPGDLRYAVRTLSKSPAFTGEERVAERISAIPV
jgi:hypothetical protein